MAMKKVVLAIAFLLCMPKLFIAQTVVSGGFVSGVWTAAGSPYQVQGSVQIQDGNTLVIEPGVEVVFQGPYKMLVMGQLLALGTVTDSIVFTTNDINVGWRGIRFNNTPATNDTSRISYCRIEYGKATGTSPENWGGGIYLNGVAKFVISNSVIENCVAQNGGGGIYSNNSNPVITNNRILHNNVSGGGGGAGICSVGWVSLPTIISNNQIYENSAPEYISGSGGGIFCDGFLHISNNSIYDNFADLQGGGIRIGGSTVVFLTDNNISNNSTNHNGGGIYCCSINNPQVERCVISNNAAENGGGIYFDCSSVPLISNSIISNNTASVGGGGLYFGLGSSQDPPIIRGVTIANNAAINGGGLYCYGSQNPIFYSSILYGNTASTTGPQGYIFDDTSDPAFYYCDIQGGSAAFELNGNFYTGTYLNNINADPIFVAPSVGSGVSYDGTTADWSLQSNSPCVDTGDPSFVSSGLDIAGNARVTVCRVDMGAYEFQNGLPLTADITMLAPIRCHGETTAVLSVSAAGSGQPYTYLWNNGEITSIIDSLGVGTYFVTLTNNTGCSVTDSIVIAQPASMYIKTASTDVSCSSECTGSAQVGVFSGGVAPYTYIWDTPNQDTTAVTVAELCAGTYTVTITDSLSCSVTASVTVTSPNNLTFTTNIMNISCHGFHNGTIQIFASGGAPPYQYSIDDGGMFSIQSTFNNLWAGVNYNVVLKDANQCKTNPMLVVLTEPDLLNVEFVIDEMSCYSSGNGHVLASVSGGTPFYNNSYHYFWSSNVGVG
ncbi:MAG: hypothetical protein CVU05_13660, partial [Bacteroidetes bacterium HGW-Bacteroidetes-21]